MQRSKNENLKNLVCRIYLNLFISGACGRVILYWPSPHFIIIRNTCIIHFFIVYIFIFLIYLFIIIYTYMFKVYYISLYLFIFGYPFIYHQRKFYWAYDVGVFSVQQPVLLSVQQPMLLPVLATSSFCCCFSLPQGTPIP